MVYSESSLNSEEVLSRGSTVESDIGVIFCDLILDVSLLLRAGYNFYKMTISCNETDKLDLYSVITFK